MDVGRGMGAGGSVVAVQATNDDATASKLSCVKKGYISDNFVQLFVRRSIKRSPIINRGYYARWASMRKLLLQFLAAEVPGSGGQPTQKQILSLGAGFDTTFFQLVVADTTNPEGTRGISSSKFVQNGPHSIIPHGLDSEVTGTEYCQNRRITRCLQDDVGALHKFVEVDFLEVTKKKASITAAKEVLLTKLGPGAEISTGRGEIISDHYYLLPADLRDRKDLDTALAKAKLDFKLPTLIIAECVLIYLDPNVSRAVVKWAADNFETAAFVIYEQIHPDDAFGQQMLRNLESRGCPLLGLHDTPTLESKEKRFTELGWQRAVALDMDAVYHQQIDPVDRRRIEHLEIFDEFEEWNIMQEHYCVAYGVKDETGLLDNFGFYKKDQHGDAGRTVMS